MKKNEPASCEGKKRLVNFSLANKIAKRQRRDAKAYKCKICGDWHVGSQEQRKPNRKKRLRYEKGI